MGARELAGAMATLLVGIVCSTEPCAGAQSYEVVDLGTLGGTTSYAYGINNDGVVVGQADLVGDAVTHAFTIVDDEIVDLGTLGGTWGRAFEISDAGHIIGWAETAGNASVHAFLIENEVMTDLVV